MAESWCGCSEDQTMKWIILHHGAIMYDSQPTAVATTIKDRGVRDVDVSRCVPAVCCERISTIF